MDLTAFERITSPGYADDVHALGVDELRRRRAECREVDDRVSFLRRVVQGRLDLVHREIARRHDGHRDGDGDAGSLLAELPELLGGPAGPSAVLARGAHLGCADLAWDETLLAELDEACGHHDITRLLEMEAPHLDDLAQRLAGLEVTVSQRRRDVHARLDALTAELTQRYRSGHATVDALLDD